MCRFFYMYRFSLQNPKKFLELRFEAEYGLRELALRPEMAKTRDQSRNLHSDFYIMLVPDPSIFRSSGCSGLRTSVCVRR